MKFTIKTLKGDMFQVEADGSETVLNVKQKISAEKADFEVERQKLIHSGKVLKDDAVLSTLAIPESDFLVCMVTAKPKAAVVAPPTQSLPTPMPAPQTTQQPAPQIGKIAAPSFLNAILYFCYLGYFHF